ncbi:hypothetical protein F4678DRAFT_475742 [Xylaria arbuscula]|nr:hypothetical protein F4678DRAFT_475742 [Xylaria arbuscula]
MTHIKMNSSPPRPRIGARGIRKVRSGCQTCKIRHKKCDESRPACLQCSGTGRQCDFMLPGQPAPGSSDRGVEDAGLSLAKYMPGSPQHPINSSKEVSSLESVQFEFFCLVCAPECGVLFEDPAWESLVLQYATVEPCIYHAALAISALTWDHYSPARHWYDPATGAQSAAEYATIQYNLALRRLNARLDSSASDRDVTKLAILCATLFIEIEFLRQESVLYFGDSLMQTHLRGATCLLRDLKSQSRLQLGSDEHCLETGVSCIKRQIKQIEEIMI